ncbi:hypothetical protein QJQ45_011991 [Haematococcus lacustris]|nr:hypothetical protein QJQ45_011991 [Haematococcus lacustris]
MPAVSWLHAPTCNVFQLRTVMVAGSLNLDVITATEWAGASLRKGKGKFRYLGKFFASPTIVPPTHQQPNICTYAQVHWWLDLDTNPCLNFQRIEESKQRPLELCQWDDLEALALVGKEYHQRYKLVNDRLPKVHPDPRTTTFTSTAAARCPGPTDCDEGNSLMLQPQQPQGWRPPVQQDPARQPFTLAQGGYPGKPGQPDRRGQSGITWATPG